MNNSRRNLKLSKKRVGAGVAVATLLISLFLPQAVGLVAVLEQPVADVICQMACEEDRGAGTIADREQ